jgi:hypothetical protein
MSCSGFFCGLSLGYIGIFISIIWLASYGISLVEYQKNKKNNCQARK